MWKPKERLRIAQDIAQRLQGDILAGRYQAGEKLPPERRLAETLGINRATLREALKHLEQMGLVRIRQGDGTRVLDFVQTAGLELLRHLGRSEQGSRSVLRDILEFRQIIGREVVRLAAQRASAEQTERLAAIAARPTTTAEETLQQDLDFYVELARATGNLVFILLLNTVRGTVGALAGLFTDFNPPAELVHVHHREVVAALRAGDAEAAASAADLHLRRGKEHLLEKLGEGPEVRVAADAGVPDALHDGGR